MDRSVHGLDRAGEWHVLKELLPDLKGKRVLDLGCGFGWHCQYALNAGAEHVTGVDLSEKMLAHAGRKCPSDKITLIHKAIEDVEFARESFDLVISSLALHYVADFDHIVRKVHASLTSHGDFIFSVEHPIFTAEGGQDWVYDEFGVPLCWPVDRYFSEGVRKTNFLGEVVRKYHRTLTSYMEGLLSSGFEIRRVIEPEPEKKLQDSVPEMKNELRRPMMLIVSARKK